MDYRQRVEHIFDQDLLRQFVLRANGHAANQNSKYSAARSKIVAYFPETARCGAACRQFLTRSKGRKMTYESDYRRYESQLNAATGGMACLALAIKQRLDCLIEALGYTSSDVKRFKCEPEHHARAVDIVSDMFCSDAIRSIVDESCVDPTCDSDADNLIAIGKGLVQELAKFHRT